MRSQIKTGIRHLGTLPPDVGQSNQPLPSEVLREQLQSVSTAVEQAIVARPGASLIVAATTGLVLGWIFKRQ